MPSDRPRDYEVGYKKPPIATRFKKGNNANPRGRPRRSNSPSSKNLATMLERALDRVVVVVEDGARRKLTKRDLVIAQLVDLSASADLRATKILLDMIHKLERGTGSAAAGTAPATGGQEFVEQLRARLAQLALTYREGAPDADPPKSQDGAHSAGKEDDR
jgi:hypothetical protein